MKRKIFTVLIALVLVISLLLVACAAPTPTPTPTPKPTPKPTPTPAPPPAEPEVIKWVMQSHEPDLPAFGPYKYVYHMTYVRRWIDYMEEATDGRLQIELVPPQAMYPNNESLTATGTGVVDASFTTCGYYAGTIPEMYVAGGMPMSWGRVEEIYDAWYSYGMYDIVNEKHAEHNVLFFPCSPMKHLNIYSTFPMPDPDSLKGRKIRGFGQWLDFIEMLGATPIAMPYADVYMGLKLGTIEGCWTTGASLEQIKMKEVVSDYVNHDNTTADAILINLDSFNKLPDDIQYTIKANTPFILSTGDLIFNQCETYMMKGVIEEYGLKLWTWSDEDLAPIRKQAVEELWPSFAEKSPTCAQLVDLIKEQLTNVGRL